MLTHIYYSKKGLKTLTIINTMDILTEAEAIHYRLFLKGNTMTPSRFWTYLLYDTRKDNDYSERYANDSFYTELSIKDALLKYGKIPLKFLQN